MNNKQKVTNLLKSLETGATEPVNYVNQNNYTQHNLSVEDGFEGMVKLFKSLPPDTKVNTVRVFQDGNFVFAHTDYNFFGPKIGFDIFRFENEKIVEHWDNLQVTPLIVNPSGHTMIDGATELKDLDKTEENKKLVTNFIDDILVNGRREKLTGYFNGDNYIQHNPIVPDQLSGLEKALAEWSKQGIAIKINKIYKVLGEGNFVLTVSEGHFGGKLSSFYDLFRVENGKIAEHWDIIEEIPNKEDWKNSNGKF